MSELSVVPLFPLSAHIFPGGKMALRIFEARYIRMVKEALKEERGFGICMLNSRGDRQENTHIYPIGTYVKVIDFDLLEDGLLGITVEGIHLFRIDNIITEKDDLRVGHVVPFESWDEDMFSNNEPRQVLQERLSQIIESYPELKTLYPDAVEDDYSWIVYRWLELLPIKAADKQQLISQSEPDSVVQFLEALVK